VAKQDAPGYEGSVTTPDSLMGFKILIEEFVKEDYKA